MVIRPPRLGFNKVTIFSIILLLIILTPIFLFWGSINAFFKDVTHQPCTVQDLNYKPLIKVSPWQWPIVINRAQFNRAKKCFPVDIFFKQSASEEQITAFLNQLKSDKNIYQVDYTSRKKAIENYKEEVKNEPVFLEIMPDGEFLPASAAIYINYPEYKNLIIRDIESNPAIEDVIAPFE